jgi:O-antigen/teichoic acid export membrane protein
VRKPLGSLTKNVAFYGAGDVAVTAAGLVLLPIYLRVLTEADFGAIALLLAVETIVKLLFRWGLDGAFMRYYLDYPDDRARAELASTLWIFLGIASGILLVALWMAAPALAHHLFKDAADTYLPSLQLILINMYLLTFTFVPFHVMRMRQHAGTFAAFTFGRSVSTLVLRIVLVLGLDWGVFGLYVADVAVTVAVLPLLWPWMRPLWRPALSGETLRRCLRFGLPRLPHGLAQQALDAGNQYLLSRFVPLDRQGVYQIGMTIGRGTKLFLSAFETGWAPFYYETARTPDARTTLSKVSTYGLAVLALLVAGSVAVASDLIAWLTPDSYQDAALVVPLIALGIALQGVYLITSIGLNITSKTQYYPLSTFAAATVGLGSGWWLMPRFGITGAAAAFALAYATLALVAGWFSRQHYPMRYERGRLIRILVAAVVAPVVAMALPTMPPVAGVAARGLTTVLVFTGLLGVGGFFRPTELAWLRQAWSARLRRRRDA